ncbi:hypothetical protein L3X38_027331 [Prunus dulcis]|uniref:Uncharacterized protein n=1 Tax=Prunus dulcis TaxID=3755 RepID=A0AAD4VMP7_PRUDU|nr:hypothetical protein L3X38_027331 [Prunus dulcis]
MAPKKDKQKESASQPKPPQSLRALPSSMNPVKPESPSQIVPFPGCSPIQVSNRFSSLGTTVGQIRPNYHSALVSSYDPFQIIPSVAQSSQSPTSSRKSSPYLPKDKSHLFIIEQVYDGIPDPITIVRSYFPSNCHFLPPCPYKNLQYYRDLLYETGSVEIKPIKDREKPHIILYHSLYIHKIISQEEFSCHPYELKHLQSTHPYNYADYIEAWNKNLNKNKTIIKSQREEDVASIALEVDVVSIVLKEDVVFISLEKDVVLTAMEDVVFAVPKQS